MKNSNFQLSGDTNNNKSNKSENRSIELMQQHIRKSVETIKTKYKLNKKFSVEEALEYIYQILSSKTIDFDKNQIREFKNKSYHELENQGFFFKQFPNVDKKPLTIYYPKLKLISINGANIMKNNEKKLGVQTRNESAQNNYFINLNESKESSSLIEEIEESSKITNLRSNLKKQFLQEFNNMEKTIKELHRIIDEKIMKGLRTTYENPNNFLKISQTKRKIKNIINEFLKNEYKNELDYQNIGNDEKNKKKNILQSKYLRKIIKNLNYKIEDEKDYNLADSEKSSRKASDSSSAIKHITNNKSSVIPAHSQKLNANFLIGKKRLKSNTNNLTISKNKYLSTLMKDCPKKMKDIIIENHSTQTGAVSMIENSVLEVKENDINKELINFTIIQNNKKVIIYIGEVKDKKLNGYGLLFHENGVIKYKGLFKDNYYHGIGVYFDHHGEIWHIGNFEKDTTIGYGVTFYMNREINMIGNFKKDKLIGNGVKILHDGFTEEGYYEKGQLSGFGTLYYDDGNFCYQGNFKNGKRHGEGIYYFEDGKYYIGNSKEGCFSGYGVYFYSKNLVWHIGKYEDNKANGFGVEYRDNGKIKYKGFYLNDEIHELGINYDNNAKAISLVKNRERLYLPVEREEIKLNDYIKKKYNYDFEKFVNEVESETKNFKFIDKHLHIKLPINKKKI